MNWVLDKNKPICPQLTEQLSMRIARGDFQPNERLMSVRDVAVQAGVNPNTVQKAFEQLEAKGLIYSIRGSGWYVSEHTAAAREEAEHLLSQKTEAFFAEMRALGFTDEQTRDYIGRWTHE